MDRKAGTLRRWWTGSHESSAQSEQDALRRGVELLASSALFDADWYAEISGSDRDPRRAARHYLRRGTRRGLPPHPLFSPQHVVAQCSRLGDGLDPLVSYLLQARFDVATHPLFDVAGYVERCPAALTHPEGPLAHYLEVGVRAGQRPNAWYEPHDARPGGLADWVVDRQREWQVARERLPRPRRSPPSQAGVRRQASEDTVAVVVQAGHEPAALETTVRSILAQTHAVEQIVVVDSAHEPGPFEWVVRRFPSAPLVHVRDDGVRESVLLNRAVARVQSDYVAWARAGELWDADRLAVLLGATPRRGAGYDVLRKVVAGKPDTYVSSQHDRCDPAVVVHVDLSRLLTSRSALAALEGFDEDLAGGWEADLSMRLLHRTPARFVPHAGVTRPVAAVEAARRPPHADRPALDPHLVASWTDVAHNKHCLPWGQPPDAGTLDSRLASIVITTSRDWRRVVSCVRRVQALGAPEGWSFEIVVVADGPDALTWQVLSSLPAQFPDVRLVLLPAEVGPALSCNLALTGLRGETVVHLDSAARPERGWLEPLLEALDDPDVLAAQSLLLSTSGTIVSAGYAFAGVGGVPYDFLRGMPVDDAAHLGAVHLPALRRAAMAARRCDLVAVRGFDPLFRGNLEDADLCLRLKSQRRGRFVVRPESRVTLVKSRKVSLLDRQLWVDRWHSAQPRDDARLWASRGFEVCRYTFGGNGPDRHLELPTPVLSRQRLTVHEISPRLRWAIKVASPVGSYGELWGDTHFARRLAVALGDLGQQVVIDHRETFDRPTAQHDDVALVLRGLEPFRPTPSQTNLCWVISHPELVSKREAAGYDLVMGASHVWSTKMSRRWRIPIETLLQATDPLLFHPDRGPADQGDPLLFVGGSRKQYRRMVKHSVSCGLPLSVYGSDWEQFIPSDIIKAQHVPNTDVGALYASASFVLNDHWDDMRKEGFLSNRLFDAVASGSRVITDDVAGIGGLFGDSVQVAADARTLTRLVREQSPDELFGSIEQRRRTAARVHREHSFAERARRLLDIAVQVRQQQGRR